MIKKISFIIMALIFAASVTGMATAAGIKCTVATVENGKVLLDCGDKADSLKVGADVIIKTVVRKAVEGC